MPLDRIEGVLAAELLALDRDGLRKGRESVIVEVLPPEGEHGPRYRLAGEGERTFLRMNSNGYLGMALRAELVAAEEEAARRFGTGPQAVRFISGTYAPHVALESALAAFHARPAAMIFSSAYAAVLGVLPPLVTPGTAVISDALNHNSIIHATRLAQPAEKRVYRHLDLGELEAALAAAAASCRRAIVVTDGVFSMRGDHAPLDRIEALVRAWDGRFAENAVLVVDDSHGVGAFGATGRGTEEVTGGRADVLIATLGKALGANGGYAATSRVLVEQLREKSPLYVYSNPITPAEAAVAGAALAILDGPRGRALLEQLRERTAEFQRGVRALGYEIIEGAHPVVPVLLRDTARTRALVRHLRAHGILATGLAYPVVPRGEDEVRFQISADQTRGDLALVLRALESFPDRG